MITCINACDERASSYALKPLNNEELPVRITTPGNLCAGGGGGGGGVGWGRGGRGGGEVL